MSIKKKLCPFLNISIIF